MDHRWTGVVLAGGKSTRMGQDKALLEVNGKPLLVHALDRLRPHVQELLLIGDPRKYGKLHAACIADDLQDLGPLGGIVTAMNHAKHDKLLVLACDVPGVNDALLHQLK
ncbi:MAG TPA: molybdenum cofactor guanylyltransferase, partial [Flavobacteriales bacterium]|nr:molybdenum cofactor guanylyltransferase [Flavobacteriales bacterium]